MGPFVFVLLFANTFFKLVFSAESVVEQYCEENISIDEGDAEQYFCETEPEKRPTKFWIENDLGHFQKASVCHELTFTCKSSYRVTWDYEGLKVSHRIDSIFYRKFASRKCPLPLPAGAFH